MRGLFTATNFLGAALLFGVQPMLGKMLLPALGGSPTVWIASMLFFQAMVLAGYQYAHRLARGSRLGSQALIHSAVACVGLASLPLSLPSAGPAAGAEPFGWLLWALAATAAVPCLALSASSPLLQRWFSRTDHPSAGDPYFLYSASNAGSLAVLALYPAVLEPVLSLSTQARLWAWGYAVFVVLTGLSGWSAGGRPASTPELRAVDPATSRGSAASEVSSGAAPLAAPADAWRRRRWTALAFVPSSLMLGLTTYLTTDVAAMPLLWVIPLGIYLSSFIVGFSRRRPRYPAWAVAAMIAALLAVMTCNLPMGFALVGHAAALAVIGTFFHGALADDRPPPEGLTEFYWRIAVGGALGGFVNAVVAPRLFATVIEYRITLAAACLLLPRDPEEEPAGAPDSGDAVFPVVVGIAAGSLAFLSGELLRDRASSAVRDAAHLAAAVLLPSAACLVSARKPLRLRLGLASVCLVSALFPAVKYSTVLLRERNFFGALCVKRDASKTAHTFVHGSTIHGRQYLAAELRGEPTMYYERGGPLGALFGDLERRGVKPDLAVAGLGTGALGAYAVAGRRLAFFEIDPAVVRIARDDRYFTFLRDAERRGVRLRVTLGDARRSLADEAGREEPYDLIILDAFSSDAIPVHLLTREALRLYLSRTTGRGLVLFHLSNRYLRIERMLGTLAREEGLRALVGTDKGDAKVGRSSTTWVLIGRREADFGELPKTRFWRALTGSTPAWTDDFSSLARVLKF